ncbi:MAG: hypothetical protein ACYTGH_19300, partial [Planctomycetota bacterium]
MISLPDLATSSEWQMSDPAGRAGAVSEWTRRRLIGSTVSTSDSEALQGLVLESYRQGMAPKNIQAIVDGYVNPPTDDSLYNISQAGQRAIGNWWQTAGSVAAWAGMEDIGRNVYTAGARMQESAQIDSVTAEKLGEWDWGDLGKKEWWSSKASEQLLTNLPLMAAGWGAGFGAAGLAARGGAGAVGQAIAGTVASTAVSTPIEALMEAGDVYSQAREGGVSHERAGEAASRVFGNNLAAIGGSNAAEFAATFALAKWVPKQVRMGFLGWMKSAAVAGGGVAAGSTVEGGQELVQKFYQDAGLQWALGERSNKPEIIPPMDAMAEMWATPEGKEAFASGVLMGLLFTGGPAMKAGGQAVIDRVESGELTRAEAMVEIDQIRRGLSQLSNEELAETASAMRVEVPEEAGRGEVIRRVARQERTIVAQEAEAREAQPQEAGPQAEAAIQEVRQAHPQLAEVEIAPVEPTESMARAKEELAAVTEAEITFVDSENPLPFDGFISQDGNSILVNARAGNPYRQVLAHELTHQLEGKSPDLFTEIVDAATQGKDWNGYVDNLNALRATNGLAPLSDDAARSEMGADYVQENVFDPKFWGRVSLRKGGIAARAESPVMGLIKKMTGRVPKS